MMIGANGRKASVSSTGIRSIWRAMNNKTSRVASSAQCASSTATITRCGRRRLCAVAGFTCGHLDFECSAPLPGHLSDGSKRDGREQIVSRSHEHSGRGRRHESANECRLPQAGISTQEHNSPAGGLEAPAECIERV